LETIQHHLRTLQVQYSLVAYLHNTVIYLMLCSTDQEYRQKTGNCSS
jgi:hypothetical protein